MQKVQCKEARIKENRPRSFKYRMDGNTHITEAGQEAVLLGKFKDGCIYGNLHIEINYIRRGYAALTVSIANKDLEPLIDLAAAELREGETLTLGFPAEKFPDGLFYPIKFIRP